MLLTIAKCQAMMRSSIVACAALGFFQSLGPVHGDEPTAGKSGMDYPSRCSSNEASRSASPASRVGGFRMECEPLAAAHILNVMCAPLCVRPRELSICLRVTDCGT